MKPEGREASVKAGIAILGLGSVGQKLEDLLQERGLHADLTVRTPGIHRDALRIGKANELASHVDKKTTVFVSLPSNGSAHRHYYEEILAQGASIVTCEKAVLANHWELVRDNPGRIKYSATVGGGSGILPAITRFQHESPQPIREIWAVVNGTLNYAADRLEEGISHDQVFDEAVQERIAEPGSEDFADMSEREFADVILKTAILANHSGMYDGIVRPRDVDEYVYEYQPGSRCSVRLTPGKIEAGYLPLLPPRVPEGVDNVVFVNGIKLAEGPGAGARATAERMFADYQELLEERQLVERRVSVS